MQGDLGGAPGLDVITGHRLHMLGLDPDELGEVAPAERLRTIFTAFLQTVPFENLSNGRAVRAYPQDPECWPRPTDRLLRENASDGLGGTSFSLSYALRDLFRGAGANAHCALGHNLVTEEAHAAVVVYDETGPLLFDPGLLLPGPVPVRPGGELDEPLGRACLKARCGATLTLCLQMLHEGEDRNIYSIIPHPAPPQNFRQAWIASIQRGRWLPLRLARRVDGEIRRYGERPGSVEFLRPSGREETRLPSRPVDQLHELFGISKPCLEEWFAEPDKGQ